MRNELLRKTLFIGVIVLLLCASFGPVTIGYIGDVDVDSSCDLVVSYDADDGLRPDVEYGPGHTNMLVSLDSGVMPLGFMLGDPITVLIVTSGHGPLTGISPQQEKDYWQSILVQLGYNNVDWYDGIPSFDLLDQYDLVIYDAGGYWYPLSNEVEALWDYHFTGKPLIVVAPDINYDWYNITGSSQPTFCHDVLHMDGALGIMPDVGFEVIADTGHDIIFSVPTGAVLPVAINSSWPDCFDPSLDCDGVLTQGYISETEFGQGSCSDLPQYSPYDPVGSLFAVIAYPGSLSEGRVVTFGFPPTALTNNDILDLLAIGTINWALEKDMKQVDLTLFVDDALQPEDAPPVVNKAPGDLMDIVSIVKNKEDSDETVNVSVTQGTWVSLEKVFVRDRFIDTDESNELTWEQKDYTWTVEIDVESDTSKQVVWRFQISDGAPSNEDFTVEGSVSVDDVECDTYDTMYSMSASAKAIIVTNRYLLYNKYDDAEVKSLLTYLYQISDTKEEDCIIYYVDRYSDTAKYWDQDIPDAIYDVGEQAVNTVANAIDDLIEDWADQTNAKYLMIVGGDETIPFYRQYHSWNLLVCLRGWCQEPDLGHASDPVTNTYHHDYYLTDMKYANDDDITHDIELCPGRIVGSSAEDMKKLIENGLKSPKVSNNVIAATLYPNLNPILTALIADKGLNILNDVENPVTVDSDTWNSTIIYEIMKNNGFSFFIHEGHSDYHGLECPQLPSILSSHYSSPVHSGAFDRIQEYRPLVSTVGCHAGVVTDDSSNSVWSPKPYDNMAWSFVHSGISSYLAPTSYGYHMTPPIGAVFSERLLVLFYDNLITDQQYTNPVGEALKNAIRDYMAPKDTTYHDGVSDVVVTEFHIYGVPWMTIDPPVTLPAGDPSSDIDINISKPEYVSDDTYKKTVEVTVNDYMISQVDGFDVIEVNGSEWVVNTGEPVLPGVLVSIALPLNATLLDVSLIQNYLTPIGYYNIPCAVPNILPNETSLITCENITGFYPSELYSSGTTLYDSYKNAGILLTLAQYNPETDEALLNNYSCFEVTYETPNPLVITDFVHDKTEYITGEQIHGNITVENLGSDDMTGLQAYLLLKNKHGEFVGYAINSSFDINSGEAKIVTVDLDQDILRGTYSLEAYVAWNEIYAMTSDYVHISSGGILDFVHSEAVVQGENIEFEIVFRNSKTSSVEASGLIYVYDPYDSLVAELPSLPITVGSNSTVPIDITWNTFGKEAGEYVAAAMIFTDDEAFGPTSDTFTILQVDTVYIDDDYDTSTPGWKIDHFDKIQDGIDAVDESGTVYVFNGTYFENVVVDKTINLTGEDRNSTIIDGGGSGDVVHILVNWVNITGFNVLNSGSGSNDAGIEIRSDYNNIIGNKVSSNNGNGIFLEFSSNNSISGNNISNNYRRGMFFIHSPDNSIISNHIFNNHQEGISLGDPKSLDPFSNTSVKNNSFINDGLSIMGAYQNTVYNNTVNGKPLVYLEEESGINISEAGQVVLVNCDNISIWNQDLSNSDIGIELWGTQHCSISNNNLSNNLVGSLILRYSCNNSITNNIITNTNWHGIYIQDSDTNNVSDNTISNNNNLGICLYSSDDNTISHCTISNNNDAGLWIYESKNSSVYSNLMVNNSCGIVSENSHQNLIVNNILNHNYWNGIWMGYSTANKIINNTLSYTTMYYGIDVAENSTDNLIKNNIVSNNNDYGISIYYSRNNSICNNIVFNNTNVGVWLHLATDNTISQNKITTNNFGIRTYLSDNNTIYHNNLINNIQNAYDECSNTWDNGYPSGGNYFDDYSGVDNYHGTNQDIPGSDGLGDTPYLISGGSNQDNYPLMEPWNVTICVNISLKTGWNLITIPVKNSWMASTLAENITGCQMVSQFDAEYQTFKTHICGVSGYNFSIKDGVGYFVYVDQNSTLSVSGQRIDNVSMPIYVEWNSIGWYHDYNTTASSLGENITGCQMVSWFDAEYQTFKTHIVGVPGYDFTITQGMGLFVYTDEASIWYGEG